jgi:hypothetical protein
MRRIWRVLLLLLLAVSPALVEEAFPPNLEALVNAVVDGDTVVLESAVMGDN